MAKVLIDSNPIDMTDMSRLHVIARLVKHKEPKLAQELVDALTSPAAKVVAKLLMGTKVTAERSLVKLADELRESVRMTAA